MIIRVTPHTFLEYLQTAREFDADHLRLNQTGWLLNNWEFADDFATYFPQERQLQTFLAPCDHCSKKRLLTARVRSEYLDMKVCGECAAAAIKLNAKFEGFADGELSMESL